MRRITIHLVLAAALAAGCGAFRNVTAEDRQVVSAYLENAAQYYDTGHYLRAFQQWGRALEIDPDEDRARLGQAMALYQLGAADTEEGLSNLAESERRLGELRGGALGGQRWKAELGYALVQMRWIQAYDRVVRLHEGNAAASRPHDPKKIDQAQAEISRRVVAAEEAFHGVLDDPKTEPNLRLPAWLGLARAAAVRGDYAKSLEWCEKYEKQVKGSVDYWRSQGAQYESKLFGAELQEAELRDVLANTNFKLGRFEQAEKDLDRLVAIQPNRASAYLNRGMLREARAAWDLARSDFGRFLQLTDMASDHPVVLEAEKRRILCEERIDAEADRDGLDAAPGRR